MTWTNIPGANSTTLSVVVDASMNGNHYLAVFTNSCGSVATDPTITLTVPGSDTFQIRYTSNLNLGDSFINITNDGQSASAMVANATSSTGNICVGVYFFDPNEELQSCCACEVTPNGLISLSVKANNTNNLTSELPNSEVVKLLAWSATSTSTATDTIFGPGSPINPTPGASVCNAASPGIFAVGMRAWGTALHAVPSGFTVSETGFSRAMLSLSEYNRLTTSCSFNQYAGSGNYGQCKGCQSGGLGAAASQ